MTINHIEEYLSAEKETELVALYNIGLLSKCLDDCEFRFFNFFSYDSGVSDTHFCEIKCGLNYINCRVLCRSFSLQQHESCFDPSYSIFSLEAWPAVVTKSGIEGGLGWGYECGAWTRQIETTITSTIYF